MSIYLLFTRGFQGSGGQTAWQPWAWAILADCVNALGYVALYRAFAIGKLVVVAPIGTSYAAITVLLSLLVGERLHTSQLLGIAAILLGVVLTTLGNEEHGPQPGAQATPQVSATSTRRVLPAGVGWALVAALGLGVTFWLLGFLITPSLGQIVPIWLFRLTGACSIIPLALLNRESLSPPIGFNMGLVSCIGLLDTGAFVASALGFATGHIALVSVLTSLYSSVVVLLAASFLHERLRVLQWLGIATILLGVVLIHF